jgi:hypothetical protein
LRVVFVKLFPPVSTMLKRMNIGEGARDPSDDDVTATHWMQSARSDDSDPQLGAAGRNRGSTTRVDGILQRVDAYSLWLGHQRAPRRGTERGIRHELPPNVRLETLIGHALRVTVVREEPSGERYGETLGEADVKRVLDRTLTLSSDAGRVWLIARSGTVRGVTHAISRDVSLSAVLSQRPAGPLVIGTSELQWLVSPGQAAKLPMPDGTTLRVLLVERRPDDTASYVLADESLFAEEWS